MLQHTKLIMRSIMIGLHGMAPMGLKKYWVNLEESRPSRTETCENQLEYIEVSGKFAITETS